MDDSIGPKDPVLVLRRHSNGTKQPSVSSNHLRVISCPDAVFVQDHVVLLRSSSMLLDDEDVSSKKPSTVSSGVAVFADRPSILSKRPVRSLHDPSNCTPNHARCSRNLLLFLQQQRLSSRDQGALSNRPSRVSTQTEGDP